MLLHAKKNIWNKKNEIETKFEQNKTNQTILIQEVQQQPPQTEMEEEQQQQQEEEASIEPESNETQEQNENNVDSISQKSAQMNGNHRENGSANAQQDDNANDDINHNKEVTNPSVMEIKGIVQGEADNNVVQSASRFSAVDDEDNKVWIRIFLCVTHRSCIHLQLKSLMLD